MKFDEYMLDVAKPGGIYIWKFPDSSDPNHEYFYYKTETELHRIGSTRQSSYVGVVWELIDLPSREGDLIDYYDPCREFNKDIKEELI